MASVSITNTFANNTTADGPQVNTNFTDLVNYINNRNDASNTWDRLSVSSSSAVPLIVNNSTGTANIANFQDNGSNVFQIIDGGNVYMNATKQLFLDGGSNTYIEESAADTMNFVSGGTSAFRITSTQDIGIIATKRFFIDGVAGAGDTYIEESSANTMNLVIGGTSTFRLDTNATATNIRLLVYSVDNGGIVRVSVGANDSGGAGFKYLRIPN